VFTPTFQATIPDLLPEEKDYTKALARARLAYDLENAASPLLAAALLTVISSRGVFITAVIGLLVSAGRCEPHLHDKASPFAAAPPNALSFFDVLMPTARRALLAEVSRPPRGRLGHLARCEPR
jgi:hypothetical protein